MPEFLGMDKKHWLWIGVAVAGVAGLYLLTHRGSGASSDTGLPATGPPQLGNMTPTAAPSSSFDSGQSVAASLSDRYHQMALATADSRLALTEQQFGVNAAIPGAQGPYGTGAVSKAWQQIQGGWEDIAHPGHIISEQQAQQLGPTNHGPYAKGAGGFFGTLLKNIGQNIQTGLQMYVGAETGALVGAGEQATTNQINGWLGATPPPYNGPYAPGYRPLSPSPTLAYGNPPARF
jgi:hypothetical protein